MSTNPPQPDSDDSSLGDSAAPELAIWEDSIGRLRQALEGDELQLYAQPIVRIADMRRAMAEVLVRLREEEALMLPPGDFIPVFEHHDMMPELDRWVVRNTLQRLAQNVAGGMRMFMINLSAQTLADPAFADFVRDAADESGIDPASLCFEIDESDVLDRMKDAARCADALRAVGCRVAVDGFGRRAASFSPLKHVRVDYIKVDGSITRYLLRKEIAQRKLDAIIRVAAAIKIDIIAEFVEEPEIVEKLRSLGVGYAQGLGIAAPQPIEDADSMG